MPEEPTLDDLPDQVYVALGRRGMEGIPLKECTYACDSDELELIEVKKDPPSISGRSLEVVIEDWLLKCAKCKKDFTIRQRVRYVDGERVDTMVSILDDRGNDLGWIGSY